MKSPDVPLVNKEKGYSKEVVRVINYKQGAAGTVTNRIYQYVRFYGAPVHEVPKESPVNDVPEYNGGANPIDPPILEKPELKVPNAPEKPKTDTPNSLPKPNPKENNLQNNNKVLPNTGLETNSSIAIIGTLALSIIGLAILKRKNNQ